MLKSKFDRKKRSLISKNRIEIREKRSVHSPKGTAPDDFSPQMNRLRTKKIQKITPGKRKAVYGYMMIRER